MFTGLIEAIGTVKQVSTRGNYRVFSISSAFPVSELALGESIACDGACLTVIDLGRDRFTVEASQETLVRTTLGNLKSGSALNLERALRADGRLGGHFVTGHVDTVGRIDERCPVGESTEFRVTYDRIFDRLVVAKGSICLNGVSLTVNDVGDGWLTVNIIPHTMKATNLAALKTGARVNLEFDLIGKYLTRILDKENNAGLTIKKLIESGW